MFTVDQVIEEYYPALNNRRIFAPIVKTVLRRLLHEQAFLDFAERYPHLRGIDLVKQVLEYFHFSYIVSDRQRENIPSTGKIVIIANHPIGTLDGLALLKLVYEVRPDARIVANDLLMSIPPLRPCLLPVRNMTGQSGKRHIQGINSALDNEEAVIIFPSGEVSRFGLQGIKDGAWHQGFLKMAERTKAPILPIHISGRNSIIFYITSILLKSFSTFMLVGEMFYQRRKQVRIRIGSIIPYETYRSIAIRRKDKIQLFKKHVYRIGTEKSPLFATDASIARPEAKPIWYNQLAAVKNLATPPMAKPSTFLSRTSYLQ